ncbi:orotidine-5'-phosphate decarboxylase [Candidatus Gracilibacteria bacterium]|nr:orotidine-5'-phosphate decarboxylase [Candidatus Gracilibacteria bacterium]
MNHKLVISLDKLSAEEALQKIQIISETLPKYKDDIVYKYNDLVALIGFSGISELLKYDDVRIMIDGKWNDIPNTIRNYIVQLHKSGLADKVDIITIHANGGRAMIREAIKTRDELGLSFEIFAISALTTLEDSDTLTIYDAMSKHTVLKLSKLALESGVDGIVCSGRETAMLRKVFFGKNFKILNPGVRFEGGESHDQKRVVTPRIAIQNGADYIVMGRPILGAKDISGAVQQFFEETREVSYISQNSQRFEKILYTGTWKEILSYIGAFYFRPKGGRYCRLTSKLVSNSYINIGAVERYYAVIDKASFEIARQLDTQDIRAEVILGAQMGSIRISLFLAKKMGVQLSIYTEKTNNDNNLMALKRHNIELKGKKVILSEDVINRGSTLEKMIEIVEEKGGTVIAITCLANRSRKTELYGIPLISCYTPEEFEIYYDENTPEEQRKDFPKLPEGAEISEKPKNDWEKLVESMRK